MSHDIEQAKRFLTLLDETETNFTFQTFDDKPSKNPALAKWVHGDIESLFNDLVNYNKLGAGVFVMVQGGDGTGRNIKAVNKIRCVFNENDNGITKKQPIEPQIVVESSPGKFHYYFLTDGLGLDDFKPIQGRLIADYGSDPNAHDLPRVLRVPGFYHNKKEPFLVKITHESGGLPYSKKQIVKAFPPYIKPIIERKETPVVHDKLAMDLRSALMYLRADDRSYWVNIGHALHELGDIGRGLWLEWSMGSDKFDMADACAKWEGFHHDNIGYKHVFSEAQKAGWINTAKKVNDVKLPEVIICDELPSFELVRICDLIANPVNIKWQVKHFIELGSVSLIYGAYGSGKSLIAFDMAFCVASGIDWHGKKTNKDSVVVLAGEGHSGIADRFNALSVNYGLPCPDNLHLSKKGARLTDRVNAAWVLDAVNAVSPDAGLIIIDTLNRNFGDGDENSSKDMTAFINSVDDHFRNTGKTVIIVHHSGKDKTKGARGSNVLPGSVEGEYEVVEKEGLVTLTCMKQKNGKKQEPLIFTMKDINLLRVDEDGDEIHSLVVSSEQFESIPKESNSTKLWRAFDVALADSELTIGGCTGCTVSYFETIAKSYFTCTKDAFRVRVSEWKNKQIASGKLLIENNIMFKR